MLRALRVIGLFVLIAPVESTVLAQPTGPVPAPVAPAVGPAAPAPVPTDPASLQKSSMTGDEMLVQAREYRRQIETTNMQVQSQVQQAKAEKDIIRLNCLLDKSTQLRVNATMMDQALQSLQDAVARRDESTELHEYTRVTIINQKVQVLRTEADGCVGAESNYVGPTRVLVEVPPNLQDEPDRPTDPTPPPTIIDDRPPPASPYQ